MDLVDGSTKNGRIIIFLERTGPTGGNSDSSKAAHDDGDASADAAQSDKGGATEAGASAKGEDAAGEEHDGGAQVQKTKGKKSKKVPKPGQLSEPKAVQKAAPMKLSPASIKEAVKKQVEGLKAAAAEGIPFCEVCDRVKKLREQLQSELA